MKTLTKILVVDDDSDILMIVDYCLSMIPGIELGLVQSGEEAIEKALSMEPDLILLDVMMPQMDGVATLKALRLIPKFSKTPVYFLTARSQKKEIEEYLKIGADDVILKPFDPLTLSQIVIDKWEKSQQTI